MRKEIHLSLGKHISELGNCVWCVELHPKCPARMAWSLVIWRLKLSAPGEINGRQGIYRKKIMGVTKASLQPVGRWVHREVEGGPRHIIGQESLHS